jgi:hypothetical protein
VVLLDNTYDASNALDGFRCPPAPGYALYVRAARRPRQREALRCEQLVAYKARPGQGSCCTGALESLRVMDNRSSRCTN